MKNSLVDKSPIKNYVQSILSIYNRRNQLLHDYNNNQVANTNINKAQFSDRMLAAPLTIARVLVHNYNFEQIDAILP